MYDENNCFEFVADINLHSIIGDKNLLTDGATTRSCGNPSHKYYNDRSHAIRLRDLGTKKELVLMSFHNVSTRTGGGKANITSYAKGFLDLVVMVHNHEGVPVIAGGDFNCDHSELREHAIACKCELRPLYPQEPHIYRHAK